MACIPAALFLCTMGLMFTPASAYQAMLSMREAFQFLSQYRVSRNVASSTSLSSSTTTDFGRLCLPRGEKYAFRKAKTILACTQDNLEGDEQENIDKKDVDVSRTRKLDSIQKEYSTTVAIIPPNNAWEPIQDLRYSLKDAGLFRWPPHINMLYPFVPKRHFQEFVPRMTDALKDIEPFEVTISTLQMFKRKRSSTLWLQPDSDGRIEAVYDALEKALPEFHDQRTRHNNKFTPHMTVTHFEHGTRNSSEGSQGIAHEECESIMQNAQKAWAPLTFRISEVHVMARDGKEGQFRLQYSIPLGSGPQMASPTLLNTAYPLMPSTPPDFTSNGRKPSSRGRKRSRGSRERRRSRDADADTLTTGQTDTGQTNQRDADPTEKSSFFQRLKDKLFGVRQQRHGRSGNVFQRLKDKLMGTRKYGNGHNRNFFQRLKDKFIGGRNKGEYPRRRNIFQRLKDKILGRKGEEKDE